MSSGSPSYLGKLLKLDEAAERLGLKLSTLRDWCFRHKLEYVKMGRAVRVSEETIQPLIERGTVPAREDGQ